VPLAKTGGGLPVVRCRFACALVATLAALVLAFPNDTVAPGNYQVDPATFTLVPAQ
jgi:hypothetical protein